MPDGPFKVYLNYIRTMLSNCWYWQRIENPSVPWTQPQAYARTYIDALDEKAGGASYSKAEMAALRPFAIVWTEDFEFARRSSAPICYPVQGVAGLQFELNTPADLSAYNNSLGEYLEETFGNIIKTDDQTKPGLLDLAGPPTYPYVNGVTRPAYSRIQKSEVEKLGDFCWLTFMIEWGIE